ncbi:MAG: dCTP deaminase [Elusimicrobia bacterium]|nr:dCTP deaminase [Elusimicrobiota bacterium]
MLKNDKWIREMSKKQKMISPFCENLITKSKVSYGLSSYGYDIRVADEYKIFTDVHNTVIDPKNFSPKAFVDLKSPYCIVPPNSFALARSIEYFKIPRGVIGLCIGKSTYARCGIVVNITPLEPEWEGHLTIEISNTTPIPAKIYSNEGIAQLIFLGSDSACETSYKDRKGKYQSQRGVTLPRMKK